MNVRGIVRIDLSRHTVGQVLTVGDVEVRQIWEQIGDGTGHYELHIGDAGNVHWGGSRVPAMLAPTAEVTVTGTDARGVEQAVEALRAEIDRLEAA